jgi:mediator of RNA polymerase II transcription subunit 14
MRIAGKLDCL